MSTINVTDTMNSLVCMSPGQLEYRQVARPSLSSPNVIIKIQRIGVCGTDLHAYSGNQPFFNYPRVFGHEISANLFESVGEVPGIDANDPVTFIPYFNCGNCIACDSGRPNCCVQLKVCGVHIDGGMSEYFSVPAACLVPGKGLSHDEMALVEPLAISAHAVKRAGVCENEFVLVVGAGPIGLGIAAVCRLSGAKVIVMDTNEFRLSFCREKLGVEWTVNPSLNDPQSLIKEITAGNGPTVVFDATGNKKAICQAFQYMAHTGRYVLVGLQNEDIHFSHPEFHKREGCLMSSRNATRMDFDYVIDCIRSGLIDPRIFITHRVTFDQVRDEFDSWLRPGNNVIKVMIELP